MTCEFHNKCKKYGETTVCSDDGAKSYYKWHSSHNHRLGTMRTAYCPYYRILRDIVKW